MALLRNREVTIESVATEIDGSTFHVRYPDGQNEIAKMHELSFTQAEYDAFVKPKLPEVKIVTDADIKNVRETQSAQHVKEDEKAKAERLKAEAEAKKYEPVATRTTVADTSKPKTLVK